MVRSVFITRASELKLSMVLIMFLLIIASCLLYFAEHNAQPKIFSSIPATLWWAVITITSVGYGDMVPITVLGKILTGIIAFTGFALFALPAGIITAGFLEEMRKMKTKKILTCPHCGKPLDHADHSEG